MTAQEQARDAYAALSGQPASFWSVVPVAEPGVWYDFFDLATGKYGQCLRKQFDDGWHQEPLGDDPTLLFYDPPGRRKK